MSYNFHIGQDVVCIQSHKQGIVKEGIIYTIKALQSSNCNCNDIELDLGYKWDYGIGLYYCSECGCTMRKYSNTAWLSSDLFAPLDELTDISELQEVLEQPLFQVK